MNGPSDATGYGSQPPTVIQWTAINTVRTRERQGSSSLSPAPPSISTPSSSSTHSNELSDEEILNGDLARLSSDNVFRVAQIYTNKEIVAKVNSHHAKLVINEDAFGLRLTRALTKIARTQGRARSDLKDDLNQARELNGVFDRMKATIGTSAKAAKAARTIQSRQASSSPRVENYEDVGSSLELEDKSDEVNDDGTEEKKETLRDEAEELIKAGSALLLNDRLLKVAGVFTVSEIVAKANVADKTMILNNRMVSERLWRATKVVAERHGKSREQVKADLEAVRREHGVGDRKVAYASATRKASQAAKRAAGASTPAVNPDAMEVDDSTGNQKDETDDEDPLGDLEEMGRRVLDGTLDDDDEPGSVEEGRRPNSPAPFDGSPAGYEIGTSHYIPGFRVYR